MKATLGELAKQLEGDLFDDITTRTLYATDASAYREIPLAVAIPKNNTDQFRNLLDRTVVLKGNSLQVEEFIRTNFIIFHDE